jgi:hypothetical protein
LTARLRETAAPAAILARVRNPVRRGFAALLSGAVLAFAAGAGRAQEPAGEPAQLDRLLKLPEGQSYGVDRRGGLSRGEWRTRFVEVRTSLDRERKALGDAQGKLDEAAGSASNWQMAPIPGMEPSPDAPLDYQLRLQIRKHKSEIDRLEKKLRELEIEANLAGVPEEWRS